jgi:hypothetical protein
MRHFVRKLRQVCTRSTELAKNRARPADRQPGTLLHQGVRGSQLLVEGRIHHAELDHVIDIPGQVNDQRRVPVHNDQVGVSERSPATSAE